MEDMWMHLVINYVGPRNYQGFDLFQDGTLVEGTQYGGDFDATPGDRFSESCALILLE